MPSQIIETETVRDNITGEIISETEQTKTVGKLPPEPNFVKLYIKAWCAFKDIKKINNAFLYECLNYLPLNGTNIISMSPYVKREIAKNLNWSEKTAIQRVNLEINKLLKAEVFKGLGGGGFMVDPTLVARGAWKDTYKAIAKFNIVGDKAGTIELDSE